MEKQHRITHVDYHCTTQSDHHFAWRLGRIQPHEDLQILTLRIKLMAGEENLYLKLHYDKGYSEVWSKDRNTQRIKISSIIYPELTDLEKLKNRLRTILVFS
jgi:hypothetical protein